MQHQAEGYTDLIPTDDLKNGNFNSYLGSVVPGVNVCTTEGTTVPLQQGMVFDPASGNPDGTGRCVFSSGGVLNVIPANRMNQGAVAFNKLIPEPNINTGVITTGTPYNIIGAKTARPLSRSIYTGRIDWNQSQNHTIWAKWSGQDGNFYEPFDLGAAGGNGSGTAHQFAQIATVGHTWTLSPSVILTGHLGFDRMSEFAHPPGYGSALGEPLLGIAESNTPAGDPRYTGLPGVSIEGFSGMGSLNSWEPDTRWASHSGSTLPPLCRTNLRRSSATWAARNRGCAGPDCGSLTQAWLASSSSRSGSTWRYALKQRTSSTILTSEVSTLAVQQLRPHPVERPLAVTPSVRSAPLTVNALCNLACSYGSSYLA